MLSVLWAQLARQMGEPCACASVPRRKEGCQILLQTFRWLPLRNCSVRISIRPLSCTGTCAGFSSRQESRWQHESTPPMNKSHATASRTRYAFHQECGGAAAAPTAAWLVIERVHNSMCAFPNGRPMTNLQSWRHGRVPEPLDAELLMAYTLYRSVRATQVCLRCLAGQIEARITCAFRPPDLGSNNAIPVRSRTNHRCERHACQ